jgi:hypothetical protein
MIQSRTPTAEEKAWLNAICQIGCIVCRLHLSCYSPAEPHHLDGRTKPGAHLQTIPLCPRHHRLPGKGYVSRADGKKAFEAAYGTEAELLEKTKLLVYDLS